MGFWKRTDRFLAHTVTKIGGIIRFMVQFMPKPDLKDEPIPFASLRKPLSRCRVALVTTCGIHPVSHPPFDMESRRGDPTFREFQWSEIKEGRYLVSHSHVDPAAILADINVALPVNRLEELVNQGIVGSLHASAISFMGYIPSTGPLRKKFAPEAAGRLADGGVDIAILTPC
jgi:D-proline reductase (dithiol) PrdB